MENDSDSGHLVSPCTRRRSLFSHLQQWRCPCTLQRVISFDRNRTEHKAIYGPPIATRPPPLSIYTPPCRNWRRSRDIYTAILTALSNKIEYPGFGRADGQVSERTSDGQRLTLTSLGSVFPSSKYSTFSPMRCLTQTSL